MGKHRLIFGEKCKKIDGSVGNFKISNTSVTTTFAGQRPNMKTLIKLGLMQATWAWAGIILFMVLGFTKIHKTKNQMPEKHPKEIVK